MWMYERRHPDAPWITADAIARVEEFLRPDHQVYEFGAGRSTMWFSQRVRRVVSIESSPEWYERVKLGAGGNTDLRLIPATEAPGDPHKDEYLAVLDECDDVDLVLIDGSYRGECATRAVRVVRPGGMIVIDNIQTFMPRPGGGLRPIPRAFQTDVVESEHWPDFLASVSGWRMEWTTNGVWDTALWWKPE